MICSECQVNFRGLKIGNMIIHHSTVSENAQIIRHSGVSGFVVACRDSCFAVACRVPSETLYTRVADDAFQNAMSFRSQNPALDHPCLHAKGDPLAQDPDPDMHHQGII